MLLTVQNQHYKILTFKNKDAQDYSANFRLHFTYFAIYKKQHIEDQLQLFSKLAVSFYWAFGKK